MSTKRLLEENVDDSMSKKNKVSEELVLVEKPVSNQVILKDDEKRTSNLQAPTMLLTGHDGAIYSLSFDPSGQHLASSSLDNNIFLWNVYGDCSNYNVLSGHKNGVLEVKWTNTNKIVSCSADKSVILWDANRGEKIRKYNSHFGIINSCSVARDTPQIFASGSDDCSVNIWDEREKYSICNLKHKYQLTSVCLSHDGFDVYTGGIDNVIRRWDLRKQEPIISLNLHGHMDTITGLALNPNGTHLLSTAMDSALCSWDIRPFVVNENQRCERMFAGARHGAEKMLLRCSWSPDGDQVACGSADRIVHIWDSTSCEQLYYLPGHKGSVNEVIFHPTEPIIASCGSDRQIFLGELAKD